MIPVSAGVLLLLALLVLFGLLVVFEVRLLSYAYRKIGIDRRYVFAVLVLTFIGSHVNIPVYSAEDGTVVAVNVGGALIPVVVSVYLLFQARMPLRMAAAVAVVAVVVHSLARLVPGVGIVVPALIPPLAAAAVSLLVAFRRAPPVAYVAGSMGALIGADLWTGRPRPGCRRRTRLIVSLRVSANFGFLLVHTLPRTPPHSVRVEISRE
jgi:uncharacterized membrane protein